MEEGLTSEATEYESFTVGLNRIASLAHSMKEQAGTTGLPPSFTGPRAPDRREKAFRTAVWAAEELER